MKLALEQIAKPADRSFHVLLTPGLNDYYYWHFHPEVEIVFVEGATGTRHIGDHISRYEGSDLVLIGSNIPHMNFDYGVSASCEQVVIQMKEDFLGRDFFGLPEMKMVGELFDKASGGIAFYGETKRVAGEMLKALPQLDSFSQLLQLLKVLEYLSKSDETEMLGAKALEDHAGIKSQHRLKLLNRYVEENFTGSPDSNEAAKKVNLSTAAFCRYCKKVTGYTFTDYVNKYRINHARKLLLMDKNVTEACYESGFENLSHFNRTFKKFTGENPSVFRKKQVG
jgi:AraC-like DNA-binding protein